MGNQLKEKSQKHFNTIAENYEDSHDGKFVKCMYEDIVQRVLSLEKEQKEILDLGCGNGKVIKLLSDKTNAKFYGIDLSEKMIEEASKQLKDRASLSVGDAEELPYEDKKFDVVICNASFHHYPQPKKVLREVKRVLKPNGVFILGDPTVPFKLYIKFFNWTLKYSKSGDVHIYEKKEIISLLQEECFNVSNWKMIKMRAFILNASV